MISQSARLDSLGTEVLARRCAHPDQIVRVHRSEIGFPEAVKEVHERGEAHFAPRNTKRFAGTNTRSVPRLASSFLVGVPRHARVRQASAITPAVVLLAISGAMRSIP